MLKLIPTTEGPINHVNIKNKHVVISIVLISNHAIIALMNQPYQPPVPTLHHNLIRELITYGSNNIAMLAKTL